MQAAYEVRIRRRRNIGTIPPGQARGNWYDLAAMTCLSGLNINFCGCLDETQSHLQDLLNIGAPIPDPTIHQGFASAWASAYSETGAAAPRELSTVDEYIYPSPFPGAHPDWQRAIELANAGRAEESARLAKALGDEQWNR